MAAARKEYRSDTERRAEADKRQAVGNDSSQAQIRQGQGCKTVMPTEVEIADPVAVRIIADLQQSQLAVIGPVADGRRNKEIGEMLGCSEQMIKNKLRAVYDAVGVDSRLQLALFVLNHPMLRQAADEALRTRLA